MKPYEQYVDGAIEIIDIKTIQNLLRWRLQ